MVKSYPFDSILSQYSLDEKDADISLKDVRGSVVYDRKVEKVDPYWMRLELTVIDREVLY